MFTTSVHYFYSKLMFPTFSINLVHKSGSNNLYSQHKTMLKIIFETYFINCCSQILFSPLVQSFCLHLLFTTFHQVFFKTWDRNNCSHQLFYKFDRQLMLKTLVSLVTVWICSRCSQEPKFNVSLKWGQ